MQKNQEHYLFYIPLIFMVSLLSSVGIFGQCTYPTEVVITDNDTSNITFVVRGATNNNLATNGVCGVRIKFTHDYVGDLSIYLVSPAGQEVQLVGPSVDASSLTQFVNWDVTFIPCGIPASPDPGLFPIWNNLGNWFQFNTYDGTYYPSNGCLEDLNMGTVNGNWTLRVEDAVEYGSGNIESASLIFCDDTGIECESCVANAGQFTQTSYSECEGKEELKFYPDIDYIGPVPPDNFYTYLFIILDVNGYVDLQDTVDLTGFNPATYQICGLSIESNEISGLNITFGMNKSDIEELLFDRGYCADISEQCITYVVQDVRDTIFINETICTGEVYDYNGEIFDSTGTYLLGYSPGTCDNVNILNLDYYNIQANIEVAGNPQLTCLNDRIKLDGTSSIADGPIRYQWTTDNGYIRTSDTLSSIVVSHTGTYYLEITSGNCVSRDTFNIFGDGSNPEIRLFYDTLSCNDRSTLVQLTSKGSYANARWDGPTFSRSGDNIISSIPGDYYLTITNNDGCTLFDTAFIYGDLDVEDPIFDIPDIECTNEVIQPNMTFVDGTGLTFSWTGPDNFSSALQNPDITKAGFYRVTIGAENGCTEQHSIPVNDIRQFARVNTMADTLTCSMTSVSISASSNLRNVTYDWTGPRGFTSTEQTPQVNTSGSYYVTVTTDQQCSTVDTVLVQQDLIPPQINAPDITISCSNSGSIPLAVTSSDQIIAYSWIGPGGFMASGPNPLASVLGRYRVTATGENGCTARANLDLVPANDIPNITFISDTIHCDNRSVTINPSTTNALSFEYIFPDGSISNVSNPTINQAGIYSIQVAQGPCLADYTHRVLVDTMSPVITFDVEEIDCDADSVTLNYISSRPLRSGLWEGPSMFSSDIQNPFVDFPATFTFTGEAYNGCQTIDSVDVRENFDIPQLTPRNINFTCRRNAVRLRVDVNIPVMTYNWTGPDGFTSNDVRPRTGREGTYYVTVIGENGCVNSDSVRVAYDTVAPQVNLSVDTILTCDDPEVTLMAEINESRISTFWQGPSESSDGGRTLDVSEEGLWKIIVTDNVGCIGRDSILVESGIIYPDIEIDKTIITCKDPETQINITLDQLVDSIKWDGSLGIPDNLVSVNSSRAGIYSFTAFANNGCDTTYTFEVLGDTIPENFNISYSDTLSCNVPVVNLMPGNSAPLEDFEWYFNNQLVSQVRRPEFSESGNYILRAAGSNGCYKNDSIYLPIDTIRPSVETFPDTVTCRNPRPYLEFLTNINDPEIIWTSDFGYTSEAIRSRTDTGGIYTIKVFGKNGCVGTSSVEIISNNSPPNVLLDSITYMFCDGASVPIDLVVLDDNLTFQWFYNGNNYLGDMPDLIADSVGIYDVYINGQNGCGIVKSTQAIIDTREPEYTTFTDIITCNKEVVTVGAEFITKDVTWRWVWPNGFVSRDTTLETSIPGDYTLSVTRSNRCMDTMIVNVQADTISPNVIIDQNQIIQCERRIINLDGSNSTSTNGASYIWSSPNGEILAGIESPIVTIRDTGNYQLKMVDNFSGCVDSLSITVVENPQEFMDFELMVNNPFCAGYENGSIIITNYRGGYGPFEVSLDGEFFAEKDDLRFLGPGTYNVTVQDSFGCLVSKEAIVEEPQPIFLDLGNDTLIRFGDSVTILGNATISSADISEFVWSPQRELSCTDCIQPVARPTSTTRYMLTIYDENGCEASSEVIIRVDEEPDITLPTIFRPSSDQGNDTFFLPQTRGVSQVNFMSIYDRWGNRLYHKENFLPGEKEMGWDGRFQGQQVQPAVFIVVTELMLINGENLTIISDVTLLR